MRSGIRAALGAILTVGAMAVGLVTATAPAAAASDTMDYPTSWARVDSRAAADTITSGDALVGAHRDEENRHHLSKSYFTFDLTDYHGRDVFTAAFGVRLLAANDCSVESAVELWRTDPADVPTWADQPAESSRITGPNHTECPTGYLVWNVMDAVTAAVAAGEPSISFVLRVSEDHQGDLAHGRTFGSTPGLSMTHNGSPNAPTELRVDHHLCGDSAALLHPSEGVSLSGTVSDPDALNVLDARVQAWEVTEPADVLEMTTHARNGLFLVTFPGSRITDGATYQWRVRTEDQDGAVSAWSPPCAFTVDRSSPEVAPTVTSERFVENGGPPGVTGPGDFTFTANGVADVVRFDWSGIGVPYGSVAADRPGGSATVTIMPETDGPVDISVWSVDAAGNFSAARSYRFWVAANWPLTSFDYQHHQGERVPVTLTARQEGATTFTYIWQVEEGAPEHTIPVGADGTASLVVDIPISGSGGWEFTVWTTDADGQRSQVNRHMVYINNEVPRVRLNAREVALGEQLTATINPVFLGDVISYRWRIDDGPEHTVEPNADDTAQFTFTPTEPGDHRLILHATYANGGISGTTRLPFTVSG